ncbi:MAG TPA: hypothetical protein VFK02_12515 [Kofleriaceae bacterium]|nr:hypothetical protein [Kofleriaceae bacterium]
MRVDELAQRLAACRMTELATALAMDPQVSDVWRAYPDPQSYVALVEDHRRPVSIRFAAALMLRSAEQSQLPRADPHMVAQVFATALQQNLAGYAFSWGWLWAPGDSLGSLGRVFVEIGRPAEHALEPLLEDPTPLDTYLGRDQAIPMARRQYRVKDFAAFYLARISSVDLPWEPDLARRDEAIARLRSRLALTRPAAVPAGSPGGATSFQLGGS